MTDEQDLEIVYQRLIGAYGDELSIRKNKNEEGVLESLTIYTGVDSLHIASTDEKPGMLEVYGTAPAFQESIDREVNADPTEVSTLVKNAFMR